jgi:3-deoxy-D-manno-octulosonate 8-phosphate phosphatase (KDO 8-P phosphatase)
MKQQRTARPSLKELARRSQRVQLLLTDNDGVLTDAGVYYSENGEAFKRFSIRDGMGIVLLRNAGIETAIITSENSPSVRRRAEKLKMGHLFLAVVDKRAHLDTILSETGLPLDSLAYIGDDVNDLEIMKTISAKGITACPQDAMPVIRRVAHYVCKAGGGHGAFRDFAEWLLRLRGNSNTNFRA